MFALPFNETSCSLQVHDGGENGAVIDWVVMKPSSSSGDPMPQDNTKPPYSCEHCSYKSMKKSNFMTHVRTHTGERPFSCPHCERSFTQKIHLEDHVRTHTGECLFSCTVCTSRFARKSHLTEHLRRHTGERPFGCPHCPYRCARKSTLKVHLMTKHTSLN